MVEDVTGGFRGEFCSSEVRVQGESAEVGGDGEVGGRGKENMAEVRRIMGSGNWCSRVRVMQGIETQSAEDEYDDEGAQRRGLCGEYGGGF